MHVGNTWNVLSLSTADASVLFVDRLNKTVNYSTSIIIVYTTKTRGVIVQT